MRSGLPNEVSTQTYQVSNSDGGGGCGQLDLSGGPSGGSGGPFVMSLMLGLAMVFLAQMAQRLRRNRR